MEKIIKYKVDFINKEFENEVYNMCCKLDGGYYLLNKNSVIFSPIEKYLYDTCIFHCSNNNISFMDENYNCEFWFKHSTPNNNNNKLGYNSLHFDYDNNDRKFNELALYTIIASLTDSMVPTIVTNVTVDPVNISQPAVSFILPEKNSQILFDGGHFMHGSLPFMKEHTQHERAQLVINIWKNHIPSAKMYYPVSEYKNTYDVITHPVKIQPKILNNLRFESLGREPYYNLIYRYIKDNPDPNYNEDYMENHIKIIEPFYKVIKNHITRSCDIYTVYHPIYKNFFCPDNSYKFVLVNVATDATNIGYTNYIHQLHKYGIHYKTLGLNKPWKGGNMEEGMGGGYKINLLQEELSTWDTNTLHSTILLFTDSYDVLINSTENNILNRYYDAMTKYNKHNCVLFSAEKDCWPDRTLMCKYPKYNSPYLYLNSGGFIGTAHNIYSLIMDATISNTDDDQLFFTNLYLTDTLKQRIALDYDCYLFQTLNNSLSDISFHGKYIIRNIVFNTYPLVIHGNGPLQYKQIMYRLFYIIKHGLYKLKYAGNDLYTPHNMESVMYNNKPYLDTCL